jgi:hypothetical protein
MKRILIICLVCFVALSATAQKKKRKKGTNKVTTTQVQTKFVTQPACVQTLIETYSKGKVENPPRSIYSYTYKGKTVYYVTAPCCDFFSDLYDENCNLIGHPDGGFTGRGDMKMPDFEKEKSNEKLVWKDERK